MENTHKHIVLIVIIIGSIIASVYFYQRNARYVEPGGSPGQTLSAEEQRRNEVLVSMQKTSGTSTPPVQDRNAILKKMASQSKKPTLEDEKKRQMILDIMSNQ